MVSGPSVFPSGTNANEHEFTQWRSFGSGLLNPSPRKTCPRCLFFVFFEYFRRHVIGNGFEFFSSIRLRICRVLMVGRRTDHVSIQIIKILHALGWKMTRLRRRA